MGLIGKTVSTSNISLIEYLYPNYQVKESLFFDKDSDVIYVGKMRKDLLEYLREGTSTFINTVGVCDVDLDNRESMLNLVYEKHGKEISEKIKEVIMSLNDKDFVNYVKSYWVLGKSTYENNTEVTIYDLYKNMVSFNQSVKVFHKLRETYPNEVLLSSIESFIERLVNIKDISVSARYTTLLNDFLMSRGKDLYRVLLKYYQMKENKDFKALWLIYALGGGSLN
jgi:hypothetical protein